MSNLGSNFLGALLSNNRAAIEEAYQIYEFYQQALFSGADPILSEFNHKELETGIQQLMGNGNISIEKLKRVHDHLEYITEKYEDLLDDLNKSSKFSRISDSMVEAFTAFSQADQKRREKQILEISKMFEKSGNVNAAKHLVASTKGRNFSDQVNMLKHFSKQLNRSLEADQDTEFVFNSVKSSAISKLEASKKSKERRLELEKEQKELEQQYKNRKEELSFKNQFKKGLKNKWNETVDDALGEIPLIGGILQKRREAKLELKRELEELEEQYRKDEEIKNKRVLEEFKEQQELSLKKNRENEKLGYENPSPIKLSPPSSKLPDSKLPLQQPSETVVKSMIAQVKSSKEIEDATFESIDELKDLSLKTDKVILNTEHTFQSLDKLIEYYSRKENQEELESLKKKSEKKDQDGQEEEGGVLDSIMDSLGDFGGRWGSKVKKGGKGLLDKLKNGAKVVTSFGGTALSAGTGILSKGANLLGKVAAPLAIAKGAYDLYDGYDSEKAKSLYGDDKVSSKTGSAISNAVSELTFGLVDQKTIASGLSTLSELTGIGKAVDAFSEGDLTGGVKSLWNASPLGRMSNWIFGDDEEKKEAEKLVEEQKKDLVQTQTDQLKLNSEPLNKGFQNMFDFMAQIPGIGVFFQDKTANVTQSQIKDAKEEFAGMIVAGVAAGNGLTINSNGQVDVQTEQQKSQEAKEIQQASVSNGTSGDPNKNVSGKGNAAQARDEYVKLARANGVSEQDIEFALSNMAKETGGFTHSVESGNYSANAIKNVAGFESRLAKASWTPEAMEKQNRADGGRTMFNILYGSRMGNKGGEDGWNFRGRGLVQLTGRENYQKIGDMIGVDLVNNPDLVNDPVIGAKVADAYFKMKKSYGKDWEGFAKTINPGDKQAANKAAVYRNAVKKQILNTPVESTSQPIQQSEAPKPVEMSNIAETAIAKQTKLTQDQANAVKSGKLNLTQNFKAQEQAGYDPKVRYFDAPPGQISKNDVTKLDGNLYDNLNKMAHAYTQKTGKRFTVTNSFRSFEEQKALYENPKYQANKPGYSLHEYGLAVDIKPEQANELDKMGLLNQFGFYRPLPDHPKEVQHVQPKSIGSSELANTGDSQLASESAESSSQSSESSSAQPAQTTQVDQTAQSNQQVPQDIASSNQSPKSSTEDQILKSQPVDMNSVYEKRFEGIHTSSLPSFMETGDIVPPTAKQEAEEKVKVEEEKKVKEIQTLAGINQSKTVTSSGALTKTRTSSYDQSLFNDWIDDIGLVAYNKFQLG